MGISPGRARPYTERERAHQRSSFSCTARDSLGKSVSKDVCFLLVRERFTKNPALRNQWMQFVFPAQQRSFSSVFADE